MKKNVSKFLGILVCSISVFSSGLVHGVKPWRINEDSALLSCMSEMGENWLLISKKAFGGKRAPGECKNRYYMHLAPGLSKVWERKEVDTLHRKVLSIGCFWKELEQYFNVPAVIIMNKYYETLEEYETLMKTMGQDCTWLPKRMWVNDVDISD